MFYTQNSQNPDKEMKNITEQFSICLKALTWLKGQILPPVQEWIVSSIKYPPRNGDGSFLADTSSLLQIGQGVDLVGEKGDGQGGRTELEKAGWVGKKEKCKESKTGIKTF